MKVVISILCRNNLTLSKAAIRSALAQEHDGTVDVLAVDNASTDSTPQWLATQTNVMTMLFTERKSVAASWNCVLEWAFRYPQNYDGVLVLNNDTEIRPDTVKWLMANPAPFVTAISVRTREELNYPNPPTTERPHPDYSCYLMKPECWKRVGPFDEGMELAFCEDSDHHVRMHHVGIKAVGLDLPFLHHGSQTVKRADPAESRLIQRAAQRNRARFKAKYGCEPGTKEYEALFA